MTFCSNTVRRAHVAAWAIALSGLSGAAGTASAAPVQWTGAGSNGHYYEYFRTAPGQPNTFAAAFNYATSSTHLGMQGYLVTITSAAEDAFVSGLAQGQFFIGAGDIGALGVFRWLGGPEGGQGFWQRGVGNVGSAIGGAYAGWNPGEPNDGGAFVPGSEVNIVGNFAQGGWNDVPNSYAAGFVVEYGPAATTVIPVPAALPLLASGLGLLGFGLRRRKV
jgi:hypothetical protein